MTYLLASLASMLYVGLKAFQQLNVAHDNRLSIIPTSLGMAVCEVYVVANVVLKGFDPLLIVCVGLGSGVGCLIAMSLHKRMRNQ